MGSPSDPGVSNVTDQMKTRLQIAASEFENAYDANHWSNYSRYSKSRPSYACHNGTSLQDPNGPSGSPSFESSPVHFSSGHGLQSRTNSSSTVETEAIGIKYGSTFILLFPISDISL